MILRAADYAEGKADQPPEELSNAFKTEKYGLPLAGGWLEQPFAFMLRLSYAYAVYVAVRSWRNSSAWKTFKDEHPGRWELVAQVLKLRKAKQNEHNESNSSDLN